MRTFLLLISLLIFQNSIGQSDFTKSFSIGLANNSINIFNTDPDKKTTFFSPGVFSSFFIKDRFAMEIGIFAEQSNYQIVDRSLIFGTNIIGGANVGNSSALIANIEESSINWNHSIKFYLRKDKIIQPFIGAGYSLRFISDIDGERFLKEGDLDWRNLNVPADIDENYFHPGFQTNAGIDFFLAEKFMLTFQTGWNYFFKTDLPRYNPVNNQINQNGVKYSLSQFTFRVGVAYVFKTKNAEN